MIRQSLPLILSAIILTSCVLVSAPDTGKANMVILAPLAKDDLTCTKHIHGNITVAYPLIPEDLDTYRIAIMDKGRRDYLAQMRWAGFLPGIIQSAFTESLNDVGNAFTDDQIVGSGRQLLTEVRRFEVVYDMNDLPSKVVIEMEFEVRTNNAAEIKRQFVLSQSVDIKENSVHGIIQAFREGFDLIQNDLITKLAGCSY